MNDDELGFVQTPPALADVLAAETLLTAPDSDDTILYPGAGRGNLAAAIHRRCSVRGLDCPSAVFVERNPAHIDDLKQRFCGSDATLNNGVPPLSAEQTQYHQPCYPPSSATGQPTSVKADVAIYKQDFLRSPPGEQAPFDYVVMNPPYTYYEKIGVADREEYAELFETATGQYHLFSPFVEQALSLLADDGVLVALLPFRGFWSGGAAAFRDHLRTYHACTPLLMPEVAFQDHMVETQAVTVGCSGGMPWGAPTPPRKTALSPTHLGHRALDHIVTHAEESCDREQSYLEAVKSRQQNAGAYDRRDRDEGQQSASVAQSHSSENKRQATLKQW
jgi:hypothetical protein